MSDSSGEDSDKLCKYHGAHCIQIKRLESDLVTCRLEIKDFRTTIVHEFERRDDISKETLVTKDEFNPVRKLVYGVIIVILAEVVRRAF